MGGRCAVGKPQARLRSEGSGIAVETRHSFVKNEANPFWPTPRWAGRESLHFLAVLFRIGPT